MRIALALLFIAVVCAVAPAGMLVAEVVDKIAIVVNDEVITEGEVDRLMLPAYEKYRNILKGSELMKKLEETRQQIIEQLIEDKLMLSEAKKQNITVDDREVVTKLNDVMNHFPSKAEFDEALKKQHITSKDLKLRYWEQLMVKKAVDKSVGSRVLMSPVDVNNYYNNHISDFVIPAEVKLWNILIKPDPVNPQKRYELAREVMRRLREGGDFIALAKVYSEGPNASDGGSMGYIKKGDLMPELEKEAFSLKAGEVSNIVQTSVGYHIFMVEEIREARTPSLAEVRRQIEEMVFRDKMQAKAKEWVGGLKKNAYIAFK